MEEPQYWRFAPGVQQEFPSLSNLSQIRVHSRCAYTGMPSSQLYKILGKHHIYQARVWSLWPLILFPQQEVEHECRHLETQQINNKRALQLPCIFKK